MKPLKLKLQGFIGILKGLGKEVLELDLTTIPDDKKLVALVGPNGRAKSTILDNLHPYRVMPSRSTTLGPGGFSYWDQLTGLTASKELEWTHGSRRFLTSFSFKVKSRKADYYLYEWCEAQQDWKPCVTPEGVVSDSKADTYDSCVESILSTPERFFTSQFAAQGRKALSKYGAGEVKSLLASMLNLQLFTQLGSKAATVAKLLRFQLDALQDDLAQARTAEVAIAQTMQQLDTHALQAAEHDKQVLISEESCASARAELATIEAKRSSQASVIEEAKFLQSQIANVGAAATTAKASMSKQQSDEIARITTDMNRIDGEVKAGRMNMACVEAEIKRFEMITSQKQAIEDAVAALPKLREQVQALDISLADNHQKLADLKPLRERLQLLVGEMARVQASGEGQKLMLTQLTETASLIDQVPCQSTPMQSSCQLLSKANAASERLPNDVREFEATRNKYRNIKIEADSVHIQLAVSTQYEDAIKAATAERKQLTAKIESLQPLAARSEMLEMATAKLPELVESKHKRAEELEAQSQSWATLRDSLTSIKAEHQRINETLHAQYAKDISILQDRLAALAKPIAESDVSACKNRVSAAVEHVTAAKARAQAHIDTKSSLLAKIEVLTNLKEKTQETQAQASRIQDEIAKWKLIEKGMGNDGLVALSIDDAGPEISRLCNELLAQDEERRFTVRLDTQRELGTGNLKETFEIMVFDNRGGKECPIGWTSGGEQVWVNECLTRAIALHTSEAGAMGYQTLFTDETDGAFDPKRKRQFMQMKRKVLEQGGYEREYFISQTPELWDLADHIIHMDSLI